MANKILLIGESSSGKSTSLRTLKPEETFIINVIGKTLPFKGWKKSYPKFDREKNVGNIITITEASGILQCMKYVNGSRPEIKNLIVDDAQYVMSYEFMARAKERGFDKFTEIAQNMFNVLTAPDTFREDLNVIFINHSEDVTTSTGSRTKMKTIGKMLDEKITIEGMFTIVLLATSFKNSDKQMEYVFITRSNGTNPAKSPIGMFDGITIPNDMAMVLDKIHKYDNE